MSFIERENIPYPLPTGFYGCVSCGIKYAERSGMYVCIDSECVSSLTLDNCIAIEAA